MTDTRTIFADGILEGSVTHGVVRLTLGQAGPDGKLLPAGQLVMPLIQVGGFINGLVGLMRQVEARLKEAQQAAGQPGTPAAPGAAPTEGVPPAAIDSAFRFGNG